MQEVEAELGRRSLREFIEMAWPVLEPGTEFVPNWHIDAICDHLEAVSKGQIPSLVINIPPRCMKSLIVGVLWPAWSWIDNPRSRWLCSSYALQLAIRDNRKMRQLITSPWYEERWGWAFDLTSDQNAKVRFENDMQGYRLAASVDGAATGEGGDYIVVDDAHNVREAESEIARQSAIDWWKESMSSRGNDPENFSKIVVGQRVHEGDLSNHVLENDDDVVHLLLPMRYEDTGCPVKKKHVCSQTKRGTTISFVDPRQTDGELLWKDRFTEKATKRLEKSLGPYAAASQLQQRPAPRKGGFFDIEQIEIVKSIPSEVVESIRAWDKAATPDGGARTSGSRIDRLKDGRYLIRHIHKGQWSTDRREKNIQMIAKADGTDVSIWMEQEPGSGGKDSVKYSIRGLAGFNARAERATGDKMIRAEPFAAQVGAGNVLMLEGEWNQDCLDELRSFGPLARFKDQVDSLSLAFNKIALMDSVWGDFYGEAADDDLPDEEKTAWA